MGSAVSAALTARCLWAVRDLCVAPLDARQALVARCRRMVDSVRHTGTVVPKMERERGNGKKKVRKSRLSSVANAIRLVRDFSAEEYEIGISNLARRLGLGKSTVHRLASTRVQEDFLEKNPDTGAYRLVLALFELGTLVRRKMNFANEARPYLKSLMEKTGETAHLAVLDHASVLYINTIASRQAIRMSSDVGARAPSHSTSEGKAMLAFRPPEMVDAILVAGLAPCTPKTITKASAPA